jgi:hypothetical protein
MTPLEVITAARQFHNAVGDSFWSDAELYNYLYFAASRLATEAECIENRYTTSSVASQQEYTRPTRAFKIKRVEYANQKLDVIDFRGLDSVYLNSTTTVTGTPQYYYEFDDVIGLYPIPDTADDTIKIYSYDYPSVPSATSTLEMPVQYHRALVMGVRALMAPKELGHPNTVFYRDEWERAVMEVKRQERRRRRGDKFRRVLREEDLPNTQLGYL